MFKIVNKILWLLSGINSSYVHAGFIYTFNKDIYQNKNNSYGIPRVIECKMSNQVQYQLSLEHRYSQERESLVKWETKEYRREKERKGRERQAGERERDRGETDRQKEEKYKGKKERKERKRREKNKKKEIQTIIS